MAGTLKAAFREICQIMIENGLDIEQVYDDQDPKFFIGKGTLFDGSFLDKRAKPKLEKGPWTLGLRPGLFE
ncbi:hypothetical protein N7516_002457 [Penicillium verrucosum]|uniref:uncharacterized protein n=1 Tax=Penicillium verrucosum TaxID=60171 RepID=UPI0025450F49|nr:uncharacterized protein N7516_002457 [Penicillium verrucosum]KAJ5942289.1 hypothetical protein N7516_002457 [Penicillium verrucosum]